MSVSTMTIAENLRHIRERIRRAAERVGRNPDDVRLLLATKTVPPERIRAAVAAGVKLLGENRAQELQQKHDEVPGADVEWHFIGHLQRNKVPHVLRYATCIHSVDRVRLANRLHNRLLRDGRTIDVLIQVNTSYEESKFGVAPEEAVSLVEHVAGLDTMRIKGLMTIGKFSADADDARRCFRRLRELRDEVRKRAIPGVAMDELSMGMSGDLEIAVEEGATIVRVGTAVFGQRQYPDSYYWNEGR